MAARTRAGLRMRTSSTGTLRRRRWPDLAKLEQYFDVGVTGDAALDPSSVMHSLSTVLIGKDGKVIAWYPSNDWQPAELVAKMKLAAAS